MSQQTTNQFLTNKKFFVLATWLFVTSFIYNRVSFAEQTNEKIKFVFFSVEPYAFKSKNEVSGIYPNIASHIAVNLNQPLQVELVPFARLATSLVEEKNSVTFSFETENLKNKTKQLDVLMEVDSVVVLLSNNKIKKDKSLKVLNIGRMRGGCLDLKPEGFAAFKFEELDNFEGGFKMLLSKRIDGVCATLDVVNHYIKELKIEPNKIGQPFVITKRRVYVYVNPQMSDSLQKNLRKSIQNVKKEALKKEPL